MSRRRVLRVAGPVSAVLRWKTQLGRNVTAVASSWQHCVRFDRPGNRTHISRADSDVPTAPTNWLLVLYLLLKDDFFKFCSLVLLSSDFNVHYERQLRKFKPRVAYFCLKSHSSKDKRMPQSHFLQCCFKVINTSLKLKITYKFCAL